MQDRLQFILLILFTLHMRHERVYIAFIFARKRKPDNHFQESFLSFNYQSLSSQTQFCAHPEQVLLIPGTEKE